MPDLYTNRLKNVLVVAPARDGSLSHLCDDRKVVFDRAGGNVENGLARWIFADVPRGTLRDQWGNPYDHQAHSLLAGNLEAGDAFVAALIDQGFSVETADALFVPLQKLDASNAETSDTLRDAHPRAFAVAIRERPSAAGLVTRLADRRVFGD